MAVLSRRPDPDPILPAPRPRRSHRATRSAFLARSLDQEAAALLSGHPELAGYFRAAAKGLLDTSEGTQ